MEDPNPKVDDTILNMVKNLKPTLNSKSLFEFTPIKRSMSSSNSNESFDEPSAKKIKRDSRLDLSYIGSPREMRRLRSDLLEARNIILTLENRITHMHGVRKEMQLMFDEENSALKRQHEYDKKSIEELENQLQIVRKREADIKKDLADVSNKYDLLKFTASERENVLEKNLEDLKQETCQNEANENEVVSKLHRRIDELETMLEAAEEDAEAQKKLAAELGKQLSEENAVKRELELKEYEVQKAKLYINDLEYAKESYLEFQEQSKMHTSKMVHYSELLKETEQLKVENVRLKDEIRNKLLLEEEVFDLKSRMSKLKEVEKKCAELQAQESQTSMYLNEWRAVARGICESTNSDSLLPHILRSAVERLQQQEVALTAEKVDLESQLKTASHEAKVAKSELEKVQQLVNDLKTTGDQKQNLIHRMQKKLLLVSRERDSYRQQLDSYEKDLTMTVNAAGGLTQPGTEKDIIANLRKTCEGYQDLINKYENDLQILQPNAYFDTASSRSEELTRLKDEIQYVRNENEMLRSRRDELEIKLEALSDGHDTLQGGQVMHLATNNPLLESIAQQENLVEKLEQEVARLKRKIKNLEEGKDTSTLGDITMNPKEVKELTEKVKAYESQIQMLKDYFKSQMMEFRNVIYMLLGYKIDRTNSSLYKLRSLYAEEPDDQLCFQVNTEGDLNLLENEYTATLEPMINLHLRHQKSIPVFLSALTMDLFNSKTMSKTFQ